LKGLEMGVEGWVPSDDEMVLLARVPNDLYDFVDEAALVSECSHSEALRLILKYAREMLEFSHWFETFHAGGRIHPRIMKMMIDRLTGSKRFSKKYVKEKRNAENSLHPAIMDRIQRGEAPIGMARAFQPTDNGGPDKIANRTTLDGFNHDRGPSKIDTPEDTQEKQSFSTGANAATALTTEVTREEHDKRVKKRAKRRKDDRLMSGSGRA
jgi:hypothetical protein